MPFVKATSYREMPTSSEVANEEYYEFLTLEKLIAKITKHQLTAFGCMCVGILSCQGQIYDLLDINDSSIKIRVSLLYMKVVLPHAGRPFTARVLGYTHWTLGAPVLFATIIKDIFPPVAEKLYDTMKWVVKNHKMVNPERRRTTRPSESAANPKAYQWANAQIPAGDYVGRIAGEEVVIRVKPEGTGPIMVDLLTYALVNTSVPICENDLLDAMSTVVHPGSLDQDIDETEQTVFTRRTNSILSRTSIGILVGKPRPSQGLSCPLTSQPP